MVRTRPPVRSTTKTIPPDTATAMGPLSCARAPGPFTLPAVVLAPTTRLTTPLGETRRARFWLKSTTTENPRAGSAATPARLLKAAASLTPSSVPVKPVPATSLTTPDGDAALSENAL